MQQVKQVMKQAGLSVPVNLLGCFFSEFMICNCDQLLLLHHTLCHAAAPSLQKKVVCFRALLRVDYKQRIHLSQKYSSYTLNFLHLDRQKYLFSLEL